MFIMNTLKGFSDSPIWFYILPIFAININSRKLNFKVEVIDV